MFNFFKKLSALLVAIILTVGLINISPAKVNAASSSDFEIGVTCHGYDINVYRTNLEEYVYKAAQLGVSLIRIDMSSSSHEAIAYQDKVVALCEGYGINLMAIVYDSQTAEILGKRYGNRIKYWQLSNECDVATILSGNGTDMNNYSINEIASAIGELKAISEQLRKYSPQSKLVINFTWTHYGFLDYLEQENVDYDVVGYDWYSNMEGYGLERALTDIRDKYGKPIIICECNIWFPDYLDDPEQLEMGPYLKQSYDLCLRFKDSHNIIGFTVYELLNEPHWANERPGESVTGLIKTNLDFTMGEPKAAYYQLQEHFGGKGSALKKIPVSSLDLEQFNTASESASNTDNSNTTASYDSKPSNSTVSDYINKQPTSNNTESAIISDDTNSSEIQTVVSQNDPQIIQSVQTSHIYKDPGFPIWLIVELSVCALGAAAAVVFIILKRRKARTTAGDANPEAKK